MKRLPITVRCCSLLMLAIITGSCIHDDTNVCPDSQPENRLVIHSFDSSGQELTGTGAVSEIRLYVFDSQNRFLESFTNNENQTATLYYPEQKFITIVGWGNSQNNMQNMPVPEKGTSIETLRMLLNRNSEGHLQSPADLFLGLTEIQLGKTVSSPGSPVTHRLDLLRRVASLEMIVSGGQKHFDTTDADLQVAVEGASESMDFRGKLIGMQGIFHPVCHFNGKGELIVDAFRLLPSESTPVAIVLYKKGTEVYRTSSDTNGNPFILKAGKLLSIHLDFEQGSSGYISFTVNEWGESNINQEF